MYSHLQGYITSKKLFKKKTYYNQIKQGVKIFNKTLLPGEC